MGADDKTRTSDTDSSMRRRRRRGDVKEEFVVSVSAIVWISVGVLFGTCFGSQALIDLIDYYHGYRWNWLERCIIDDGTFAGGYCR